MAVGGALGQNGASGSVPVGGLPEVDDDSSALTAVAHDTTLTGSGTASDKLKVAVPYTAVDLAKLAYVPAGLAVMSYFRSDIVDFAALSAGNVIVPAVAGKRFRVQGGNFVLTSLAGVCSTAAQVSYNAAAGLGTGAPANLLSVAVTNALIGVGAPVQGSSGFFPTGGSASTRVMPLNTAATVDVTTAATGTGGFAMLGFIELFGTFI